MSAPTFDEIYSIEPQLDAALDTLLTAEEINTVTPNKAANSFQKPRARVEVVTTHTDLNQSNHNVAPHFRSRLWQEAVAFTVVTNASTEADGGMRWHNQIRARVRNLMAKLRYNLIHVYPELLPYHSVANVVEQGTAPNITPQDGVLISEMNFELTVNVKPDAWPAEE